MNKTSHMLYAREWKAARYKLHGKEYKTLRGYIMARIYDDMKKNKA